MYAEGVLTDFVVAVGEKEWKVHKAVLFMHSDVLYKMSTEAQFIVLITHHLWRERAMLT